MKVAAIIGLSFMLSCSHRGVRKEFLQYLPDRKTSSHCPSLKFEAHGKKNQGEYWNRVGVCRFLAGDLNQAVFYFDMSLKKSNKKSSAAALNNLGVIHLHYKRYRRAHSFFNQALERDAGGLTVNLNMAHLYMKFQRYDSAEKMLKRMAARYAGNENIKKALARIKEMNPVRGFRADPGKR